MTYRNALGTFGLLVFSAFSAPASAEVIRVGDYYESSATIQCADVTSCLLPFAQLPTDKRTLIEHASCHALTHQPVYRIRLIASGSFGGSLLRSIDLAPSTLPPSSGWNIAPLVNEVSFLMGASRYPVVEFPTFTSSGFYLTCALSGRLAP